MSRTAYAPIATAPLGIPGRVARQTEKTTCKTSCKTACKTTRKTACKKSWSGRHTRLVLACLLSVLPAYAADAKNTTYKNPRYYSNHLPIDYCLYPTQQCGKPAADKFCKDMNAGSVITFTWAPSNSGTYIQGNGETCDTKKYSQCNAFTEIVCGSYTY